MLIGHKWKHNRRSGLAATWLTKSSKHTSWAFVDQHKIWSDVRDMERQFKIKQDAHSSNNHEIKSILWFTASARTNVQPRPISNNGSINQGQNVQGATKDSNQHECIFWMNAEPISQRRRSVTITLFIWSSQSLRNAWQKEYAWTLGPTKSFQNKAFQRKCQE
jgi:hypothetical protein